MPAFSPHSPIDKPVTIYNRFRLTQSSEPRQGKESKLRVGDIAPDFDLPVLRNGVKERLRLSSKAASSALVLAFYPLNWDDVSTRQLIEYQARRSEYTCHKADLITISVDSIMNITAWEREIGPFDFLMCSDFWPHGEVCRKYGVLRDDDPFQGAAQPALFVLGINRKIQFQKLYSVGEVAPLEDIVRALEGIH